MAAPTAASAPGTPAGNRLRNGYRCVLVFNDEPTAPIWPVSVTPPSLSGPPAIDTSTMLNDDWATRAPGALVTLGDFTFTANYATPIYTTILDILNVEGTYTIFFPDGAKLAFYAALINFVPDALVNGTMPLATCTMVATNTDPATGGEEPPVYIAASAASRAMMRRWAEASAIKGKKRVNVRPDKLNVGKRKTKTQKTSELHPEPEKEVLNV